MSFALLIREGTDDLPVGRASILLDSEAPQDGVIFHGSGKTYFCKARPTVDELASLVGSLVPEARRNSQPIIVNSNIQVPAEMSGAVGIYQDQVSARPWQLLAMPSGYDFDEG